MRYGLRQIDAPAFSPGDTRRVRLRQGSSVRAYILRVLFDWKVTGGTGKGTIYSDAYARLARRIVMSANGEDRHTYSGQAMDLLLKMLANEQHVQTPPSLLADTTDQTGREFVYLLPMFMPHSHSEDEFSFPTRRVDNPELRIQWADPADLLTSDGDATKYEIANAATELYEVTLQGSMGGQQALDIRTIQREIVQSGDIRIDLDHLRAGHEVRAVLVQAFAGGSNDRHYEYSDSLIGQIKLVIDGATPEIEDIPFRVLQNENRKDYGLSSIVTGAVLLDSATDKVTRPGELWTIGRSKPYLDLRVKKQVGDCLVVLTVLSTARIPAAAAVR